MGGVDVDLGHVPTFAHAENHMRGFRSLQVFLGGFADLLFCVVAQSIAGVYVTKGDRELQVFPSFLIQCRL